MKKTVKVLLAFVALIVSFLLPTAGSSVSAQDGEALERVQEEGVLRVGTSADYPPFEFYAEVDGEREMVGMDVSIAQNIADDLGVSLEMIDMGFDALIPALETGNIDMILAGMVETEERRQSLDFSQIYFEGGQNLMVRQDDASMYDSIESLEGQAVGAQSGSLQADLAVQVPGADVLELENINDLILALKTGRIEAVVLAQVSAEMHGMVDPDLHTFDGGFETGDEGNVIGFRQEEDSFVAAVDQSLDGMLADGLVDQYYEEAVELVGASDDFEAVEVEESSFLGTYWRYFLDGTVVTLQLAIGGVFFGLIFGSLLALMRLSSNPLLKWPALSYVEFIRGTPLMIQVMFVYFGLGMLYSMSGLTAGIIAVSVNSAAYICEIIRGGLNSVNKGQTEAARSLGMSKRESLRHIIFPQALKNIWPALGNEFIVVIKESSIVSVIGVGELIYQSRIVRSQSYRGILPLFAVMVIYFILTFTLSKILNHFEGRMNYDKR